MLHEGCCVECAQSAACVWTFIYTGVLLHWLFCCWMYTFWSYSFYSMLFSSWPELFTAWSFYHSFRGLIKFTKSVGDFFGLTLLHFTIAIATSCNANRDAVNGMSITVDVSHQSFPFWSYREAQSNWELGLLDPPAGKTRNNSKCGWR